MQTSIDNRRQSNAEYGALLAEAIKIGKQHSAKARYFVPNMYEILVRTEGLTPQDAAHRIYSDLAGVWQKDTMRRLLPVEAKDQVAREKQAQSRLQLVSNAGLILQTEEADGDARKMVIKLEQENARLSKTVEELQKERHLLQEKILRLERTQAQPLLRPVGAKKEETTIILTPRLFLKTFTLMRGSTKPLAMKVMGKEVFDVDKMM